MAIYNVEGGFYMAKKVTKINMMPAALQPRKRVAAYARVSSGKDAMLHSLSAQVSYYNELIQSRPDWKFAGVYADEALTGTKQDRPEFQRLMADCEAGRIDMVITKAISRFARNTVTTLEYVRRLREKGISVYFEEENIDTLSEGGELMLTVLSAFAQEQSYNVSEDCKWRIRNKFKEGIPNTFSILGYDTVHGQLFVNDTEAETVKLIFSDYLSGLGSLAIANKLNDLGLKTKLGKLWNAKKVRDILKNEKHAGDLILQKVYVSNHLEKKKSINEGELPMYIVHNNHEPIVDRNTFDAVQAEMHIRRQRYHVETSPAREYSYSGKIMCGICGKNYRHKINNAGTKYSKSIWICSTFNTMGKKHCQSKQIPEQILDSIVLGFDKEVRQIVVFPENRLKFIFTDSTEYETVWQAESRKWTDEMKAENYAKLRKGHKA
jgi:DNA invertase Pin-like site-specific DNA recombinase